MTQRIGYVVVFARYGDRILNLFNIDSSIRDFFESLFVRYQRRHQQRRRDYRGQTEASVTSSNVFSIVIKNDINNGTGIPAVS